MKLIICAECHESKPESRRDSIFCTECATALYRSLGEEKTVEERKAEGNALFASIKKSNEARTRWAK